MENSIQAQNYRAQYALKSGDIIKCKDDEEYTIIGDPIGYGGSSILYAASKNDTGIRFAIKEWFSNEHCMRFERTNGIIQPINPDDGMAVAQLERARENLENEARISQHLFNVNTRTVPTCEILMPISITTGGKTYTKVSAGVFSVQPQFDIKARSLEDILEGISERCTPKEKRKTRGLPNIYLVTCIMEEVLRAIQQIHNARDPEDPQIQGYCHTDIQSRNIFFAETDVSKNHAGIAYIVDYGSSMVLDHNGETKELIGKEVFSTPGYRPPEANKNGSFKLDCRADIYSAGCLLYRCVVTNAKFEIAEKKISPILGPSAINEIDGKYIGCFGRALTLLNDILDRATKEDPAERYPCIERMLDAILELKKYTELPKFVLPTNLSSPDYFVPHSRDKELSALIKSVNNGETVFLYGIGGIGKTECAIQLANRLNPPRGAYLVHFQSSMKETILKMDFTGYKFEPKQKGLSLEELEEAEYRERLEILQEHYQETVLIIDNFDVAGKTLDDLRREPAFKDFLGLNLKRIFTTRYPVGRKDWEIRELSEDALLKLMRYYYTDSSITDEQYLDILKEIRNHTLTAMLIAKTLEESWGDVTPEMILDALRGSRLSKEDYPEVVSDQNRCYQHKQIYGHLKALFDLSGMSEKDRAVLCCATLLPEGGMEVPLFRNCLEEDEKKSLHRLVKRSWLNRTETILNIHPIIREICRGELRPNNERCTQFLNTLIANSASTYGEKQITQQANVLERAIMYLQENNISWLFSVAHMYRRLGNEMKQFYVLDTICRGVAFREINDNILASHVFESMADVYEKFGDKQKRKEYLLKAIDSCLIGSNQEKLLLASLYVKLSNACHMLGDEEGRQGTVNQVLQIYSQLRGEDVSSEEYSTIMTSLGMLYCDVYDFKRMHEYCDKALMVMLKDFPENHPELAELYYYIGYALAKLKKYQEAVVYIEKAIAIWEHILPQSHPDLSKAYDIMVTIHENLNQTDFAEHFAIKAIASIKKHADQHLHEYQPDRENPDSHYESN